MYHCSVIVATYQTNMDKLLLTLHSVVEQQGIEVQLVITDDGSADNHFEEIREYFAKKEFLHYKLLAHEKNQGIVKNFLEGVRASEGSFIKLFSAGDYLYSNTTLREWCDALEKSGRNWSFGPAVYYSKLIEGIPQVVKTRTNPVDVKPYLKDNHKKCRWNYTALVDNCLGAATLIRTATIEKYLSLLEGRVKYAEDTMYLCMMADNVLPYYEQKPVIYYEYGEGISTNQNTKWKELLKKDYHEIYRIISAELTPVDALERKLQKVCRIRMKQDRFSMLRSLLFIRGCVAMNVKRVLRHE